MAPTSWHRKAEGADEPSLARPADTFGSGFAHSVSAAPPRLWLHKEATVMTEGKDVVVPLQCLASSTPLISQAAGGLKVDREAERHRTRASRCPDAELT